MIIPIAIPRMIAVIAAVVTRRRVVGIASKTATATGSEVLVWPKSNLPTKTPRIPLSHMKYRTGGGRSRRRERVIAAMRASTSGSLLARSSPTGSPDKAARLKSKKLEPKRMTPSVPRRRMMKANISLALLHYSQNQKKAQMTLVHTSVI